jgi:hypothetical protein
VLGSNPHLNVVLPKGAFYLSVTFHDTALEHLKLPPAANPGAQ